MTAETTLGFRVNDVYSFRWNDYKKSTHCFDGQLIVKQRENGDLYFMDTYWASKHNGFTHYGDNRWMSIEDAQKNGVLTFRCNLDEVEEVNEGERLYHADEDVLDLSYQNGCYKFFVKRKGAVRSKDKMIESVKQKLEDALHRKSSAEWSIEKYTELLAKVQSGDTTVYI
jgi:hypothetical protein